MEDPDEKKQSEVEDSLQALFAVSSRAERGNNGVYTAPPDSLDRVAVEDIQVLDAELEVDAIETLAEEDLEEATADVKAVFSFTDDEKTEPNRPNPLKEPTDGVIKAALEDVDQVESRRKRRQFGYTVAGAAIGGGLVWLGKILLAAHSIQGSDELTAPTSSPDYVGFEDFSTLPTHHNVPASPAAGYNESSAASEFATASGWSDSYSPSLNTSPNLQTGFVPVWTLVTSVEVQGVTDANEALVDAVTIHRLENSLGGHDWKDIRKEHPWAETPEALKAMLGHLRSWGGAEAELDAYQAALDRGEAVSSITDFLELVDTDPQLSQGTALALARKIPFVHDRRINDLKQAESLKSTPQLVYDTKTNVVADIHSGLVKPPAPFHYDSSDSKLALLEMSDEQAGSAAQENEIPDVTEFLADDDKNDDVADVSAYLEEAPAYAGLQELATWMEKSGQSLIKKARGENRKLLPAFCKGVAGDLRALAQGFEDMDASAQETAVLKLKDEFFARMKGLKNGDGHFKSKYLQDLSLQFNSALAEILPPAPDGVEALQARIRGEILATGMFRA